MLYRPQPKTFAAILRELAAGISAHFAAARRRRANARYLASLSPYLQQDLGLDRTSRGDRRFN
jgi:hypothetical protein